MQNVISNNYARKAYDKIIIGFFLHFLGNAIPAILQRQSEYITAIICTIGLFFIIRGGWMIRKKLINPFDGVYSFIFKMYLIIILLMIIKGYMIDYSFQWISFQGMINYHLFSPSYILCYLMPLVVYIPFQLINYSRIIQFSIVISIIVIIAFVLLNNIIIYNATRASLGFERTGTNGTEFSTMINQFAFFLFCYGFIKKKSWFIITLAFLCAFFIVLISGRRGSSVIYAIIFIVSLYNWQNEQKMKYRFIVLIIIAVLVITFIYLFFNSSLFNFIHTRGLEDTRSEVDIALLSQMNDLQLFFGKGLNGRYYFPIYTEGDYLNGWRYVSETGFYNIVLKGGYLMAFFHIIVLLYPALLGIFKSKNNFCKMMGIYIIISLLELYPFGHLMFNIKFLIIWTGVVLCYRKNVRNLKNEQIYLYLFRKVI